MKILTHLNLSQNELQNAVLHKLAVAPENPKVGQIYFNTEDKKAYIYQETGWENLGLSNELLAKLDAIEESADKAFYTELPAASADNAGKVAIYAGEETEDLKPGLIYISNGTTWEEATPTMTGAETDSVAVSVNEGVISAEVKVSADANNAIQVKTVDGVQGLYVEATEVGSATAEEDGLMTAEDKAKLDGIEAGAEVNVIEGVKLNGIDVALDGNRVADILIAKATADADGLMAKEDKAKLDTVAENAKDNVIEAVSFNGTAVTVENKEAKIVIAEATEEAAGLMSADDKKALAGKQDKLTAGTNVEITAENIVNVNLPTASAETAGVIKVGAGLAIDAETGVLSSTFGGEADTVKWSGVTEKPSTLGTNLEEGQYGTFTKVTFDQYGLVTAGENLVANDIPDLSATYVNVNKLGAAEGVATLDANAKVKFEQLPDSILGNVKYAGTVDPETGVCTLVDGKIIGADGTEVTELTITADNAANFRGYYFIASKSATLANIEFQVGDWCISNGTAGWAKVDNTDAVVGVKGEKETDFRIGQVNITAANVGAVEANEAIVGGTFSKVTVDEKGLVTAGSEKITTADIEDFATASQNFVAANQGAEEANKSLVTDADGNVTTVAHKFVTTIGDGTATSYTVAHNMGTKDIIVQVSDATTFEVVYANIAISTDNEISLNFASAPAANAYRVIVIA